MHATRPAHLGAALWLAATVGALTLLLATPSLSQAEESNPNNYSCLGTLAAGAPVDGSEDQQVKYSFYCNGPITGYQVQPQIPVTGISSPPLITSIGGATPGATLPDTFSCSGDIPGFAVNCVGAARGGYENVTGQFSIATKLCAEPRVDALLSVTYAYLEKGVVTQAISGPYELGRPTGCRPDALSGSTRINPHAPIKLKPGKKHRRARHHAPHHASRR